MPSWRWLLQCAASVALGNWKVAACGDGLSPRHAVICQPTDAGWFDSGSPSFARKSRGSCPAVAFPRMPREDPAFAPEELRLAKMAMATEGSAEKPRPRGGELHIFRLPDVSRIHVAISVGNERWW